VFRQVMSACLALEQRLRIAYLGPAGTFSHAAVAKHFGDFVDAEPARRSTTCSARRESGQSDYAVVPVENSTEGAVGRTLDLMCQTPLAICGEIRCAVARICCRTRRAMARSPRSIRTRNRSPNAASGSRASAAVDASPWRATPRRHGLPRGRRQRGDRRRERRGDLRLNVLARTSRTSRTTRRASGSRAAIGAALGHGRDLARDVGAEPARRAARTARSRSQRTACRCRASNRGRRAPSLWEYLFFVDLDGHASDPAVAAALAELRAIAPFSRCWARIPAAVYYEMSMTATPHAARTRQHRDPSRSRRSYVRRSRRTCRASRSASSRASSASTSDDHQARVERESARAQRRGAQAIADAMAELCRYPTATASR
jgi:chorismate mutase/prephenate dehydratase